MQLAGLHQEQKAFGSAKGVGGNQSGHQPLGIGLVAGKHPRRLAHQQFGQFAAICRYFQALDQSLRLRLRMGMGMGMGMGLGGSQGQAGKAHG